MRPFVPTNLRRAVEDIVKGDELPIRSRSVPDGSRPPSYIERILPDVVSFRVQSEDLQELGVAPQVALFYDDDAENTVLPVLIKVPNLHNAKESYQRYLDNLERSGLETKPVGPDQAQTIFVDRLSEFLAVRFTLPFPSSSITTIISSRKGDPVLCANGYFLSTSTAIGTSTPVHISLTAGRYSFGVHDSGIDKWHPNLWTCPTTANLGLP